MYRTRPAPPRPVRTNKFDEGSRRLRLMLMARILSVISERDCGTASRAIKPFSRPMRTDSFTRKKCPPAATPTQTKEWRCSSVGVTEILSDHKITPTSAAALLFTSASVRPIFYVTSFSLLTDREYEILLRVGTSESGG